MCAALIWNSLHGFWLGAYIEHKCQQWWCINKIDDDAQKWQRVMGSKKRPVKRTHRDTRKKLILITQECMQFMVYVVNTWPYSQIYALTYS